MSFCFFGLNVKSFSLNESNKSLAPLTTSHRMGSTSLLPSPSFPPPRVYRRGLVGVPLHWDCSTGRMSWDRRDVTGSSHYSLLYLFVFLSRNRCSIWLFDIVICLWSWSVPLILFLSIFLLPFDRWSTSWIRSFSIVHFLVLYSYFYFLITSS